MTENAYLQCQRCVMDKTDPFIFFDENGYCNHCTKRLKEIEYHKAQKTYDRENLLAIVNKIKRDGRGKKYDCLLGISGGLDSCYLALQLNKMGLRTLLVHMDNGWNAEAAINNIKHISKALNFDYESYVLDWQEFKDLQLSFLKASVIEAETPTDVAIVGVLHKVALKYGIKYIISGCNDESEGILPKHWHYDCRDQKFINAIQAKFGSKRLIKFPSFHFLTEGYYKLIRRVRMLYLLNYFPHSKEAAMQVLQEELNWKYYGGKHHESRYTKFVQSYLLPKKFNIDYRKATLSSLICSGYITREDALNKLKDPLYNLEEVEKEKKFIAKKLDITTQELEEILEAPPKHYSDYPNNEKTLNRIYNIYRLVFKKNFLAKYEQHGS